MVGFIDSLDNQQLQYSSAKEPTVIIQETTRVDQFNRNSDGQIIIKAHVTAQNVSPDGRTDVLADKEDRHDIDINLKSSNMLPVLEAIQKGEAPPTVELRFSDKLPLEDGTLCTPIDYSTGIDAFLIENEEVWHLGHRDKPFKTVDIILKDQYNTAADINGYECNALKLEINKDSIEELKETFTPAKKWFDFF